MPPPARDRVWQSERGPLKTYFVVRLHPWHFGRISNLHERRQSCLDQARLARPELPPQEQHSFLATQGAYVSWLAEIDANP
jgi:hypothetical protein